MLAKQAPASVSVVSSSTSSAPFDFIESQKGENIAVFEFYTYFKNRNLTGDRTNWICWEKQKDGCKGVITIGSSNNVLIVPFRPLLAEGRWPLTSIGTQDLDKVTVQSTWLSVALSCQFAQDTVGIFCRSFTRYMIMDCKR